VTDSPEVGGSELMAVLRSIDRRLMLLTAAHERDLRELLVDRLLRTSARITMFDSIDGRRGSPELARLANVSDRAAQLFIKELLELGLVREATNSAGRAVVVERDDTAIVRWSLREIP